LLAAISVIVIELVVGAVEDVEVSVGEDVLLSDVQAALISVSVAAKATAAQMLLFFISVPPSRVVECLSRVTVHDTPICRQGFV